jgi:hypothetical protein
MYHDEKIINGILHWRGTPTGEWTAYTLEQMTERVCRIERMLAQIRAVWDQ